MLLIQRLAEEKILSAIDQGELDGLPGEGKALQLDDNCYVPDELRAAYRLLKNAGYLPAELQLRNEVQQVEELLAHVETEAEEKRLLRKLSILRLQLSKHGSESSVLVQEWRYREKLIQKLK